MTDGRLVAIYVAPAAGAPMEARDRIEAIAGAGLRDDRYATGTGTYSDTGRGARDVTLIEREAVDAVRAEDGVDVREDQTRRNLVTEGVALNHLVGPRRSASGTVRMRGAAPGRAVRLPRTAHRRGRGARRVGAPRWPPGRDPRRRRTPRRRRDHRSTVRSVSGREQHKSR